jgi:tetratricopeptide (TPR) repeat protein
VLQGLTAGEIERMVASWAGGKAPEALVEAITVRTLGNPLFIREVLANLAETDVTRGPEEELAARLASLIEEHGIPEGIKEVIGRRLSRLSEPCNAVLALAAVMGREFRSSVLEQVSDLSSDALLDALDEAVGAQLITEASRVGRYAFAHPLTRETLYAELSAARRVRMHRRIGEALEELRPDEQEAHLSELAHHFLQAAGDRRDIDKAVSYARRAGDRARALFAYEEAAAHYERALQALELSDTPDLEERFELLLRLGVTARNAGDTQKKSAALDEAVRVARQSGSPLLFARAVLSLRDGYAELGLRGPDEAYVALLHEALDGLGERDAALRSQLLCYLAGEYYTSTDDERRLVTSREAVATARLANDPDALAFALGVRHYCLREPEHANERRAIVLEILELATATGTKRLALNAYTHQVEDLLHAGDVEGADRSLAARERLAAEMRVHSHLLHTQQLASMRALLDGRFDDAERLMNEALQLGQQTGSRTSFGIYNLQTFLLRKEQGRLAEIEAAHRSLAERFGELPSFRCALALLECELGQVEEARREFNAIAGQHFADIPRDTNWIIPIVFLAEVCATLRDRDRAEELFGLLTSYRGSNIVVAYATLSLGPASRYLGLLAATMARWEEASQLFDESAAMSERMRAKPWLARTHADLARMLLSRKATGDRERACELMDEAQRVAEALGMRSLLAQVHSMRELA